MFARPDLTVQIDWLGFSLIISGLIRGWIGMIASQFILTLAGLGPEFYVSRVQFG